MWSVPNWRNSTSCSAPTRAHTDEEPFDLNGVIQMAAARVLGGKRLNSVRVVDEWDEPNLEDVLELRKHVRHVEYGPWKDVICDEWPRGELRRGGLGWCLSGKLVRAS